MCFCCANARWSGGQQSKLLHFCLVLILLYVPAVLVQVCAESTSHHVLLTGSAPVSHHNMPRRQMALRLPPHILNSQSRDLLLYSRQPGLTLSKDKDAETALSFMFFVFLLSLGGRDKQLFVGKLAHSPRMCAVTVRMMLCWRNRARCTIQEQEVPKKTQLVITGGFMSDIFMSYSEA